MKNNQRPRQTRKRVKRKNMTANPLKGLPGIEDSLTRLMSDQVLLAAFRDFTWEEKLLLAPIIETFKPVLKSIMRSANAVEPLAAETPRRERQHISTHKRSNVLVLFAHCSLRVSRANLSHDNSKSNPSRERRLALLPSIQNCC